MTSAERYIAEIENLIEARSILKHPFYRAWTMGTLTLESLQDYARQYYHHVAAFPTYLSAVHAITEDQPTRREILKNLMDEEAGSPNHPELWLMFANGLGVNTSDVKNAAKYAETEGLINQFRGNCSEHGTTAGLAALYAYESQIPAVSESKIEGLKRHYGIEAAEAIRYFDVHIEADKEHSRAEREMLMQHLDDLTGPAAVESASSTLDALWDMLSGVCRHNNIPVQ